VIERAQKAKENPEVVPTFYMASYIVYVVCSSNVFGGLYLSYHVSKALVHVYCQISWENKYKNNIHPFVTFS